MTIKTIQFLSDIQSTISDHKGGLYSDEEMERTIKNLIWKFLDFNPYQTEALDREVEALREFRQKV